MTVRQACAFAEIGSAAERGLRQSLLGVYMSAGSAAMSTAVDRMVEAGLVARRDDPEDRRQVWLSLTERGREIWRQACDGR